MSACICLYLNSWPLVYTFAKARRRLFSSTFCFRPWKAPKAKKHKRLLRTEGKMQSTKHIELSVFLITPQWSKENTNEFLHKLSCHTVLWIAMLSAHLCHTSARLLIIHQERFITHFSSVLYFLIKLGHCAFFILSFGVSIIWRILYSVKVNVKCVKNVLRFSSEMNVINNNAHHEQLTLGLLGSLKCLLTLVI